YAMQRRAVAQMRDADFAAQFEVRLPVLRMTSRSHLIEAPTNVIDRRITAFDSSRENEMTARPARARRLVVRPAGAGAHRRRAGDRISHPVGVHGAADH